MEKDKKKRFLTVTEAEGVYGIPEQTWRHWWRTEDRPELQILFGRIEGTTRILVEVDASLERDLKSRLKRARELDIR
jgi:hypothetical protein